MKNKKDYVISGGNLFADLGLPNAHERNLKISIALHIKKLIDQKKYTQNRAAELLDIDQPKVSALVSGKIAGFSLERLFNFLDILGQDVTINVKPRIHNFSKKGSIKPNSIKESSIQPIGIRARAK